VQHDSLAENGNRKIIITFASHKSIRGSGERRYVSCRIFSQAFGLEQMLQIPQRWSALQLREYFLGNSHCCF